MSSARATPTAKERVLIVEPDGREARMLSLLLSWRHEAGFVPVVAHSVEEASMLAREAPPSAIIFSLSSSGSYEEAIRSLSDAAPEAPILTIGDREPATRRTTAESPLGVEDVLERSSLTAQSVNHAVRAAIGRRQRAQSEATGRLPRRVSRTVRKKCDATLTAAHGDATRTLLTAIEAEVDALRGAISKAGSREGGLRLLHEILADIERARALYEDEEKAKPSSSARERE